MENLITSPWRSATAEPKIRKKCTPQSLSISKFSQDLNNRLTSVSRSSLMRGMKPFIGSQSVSDLGLNAPFSKIIEKLDEITENKKIQHFDYPFKDDEVYSISLNKHEKAIFRVETYNRVCPLSVMLDNSGKITIFVSTKHTVPDQNNYERKFHNKNFQISDKTHRFKIKTVFFCILAEEPSEVSIQLEYKKKEESPNGKKFLSMREKSQREMEKIRNDPVLKQEFTQRVENILASRRKKALEQAGYKNFVKINKSCQTAEEKKNVIKSKSQENLKKEKSAKERKELNYQEKLQKARNVLIKQQLKEKLRKQREELRKQHLEKMEKVKIWLKIVFFIKSLFEINRKYNYLKRAKRNSLFSAVRIQKSYRRWNSQLFENISKQYIHARNTLLFFNTHLRPCTKFQNKKFFNFLNQQISSQKPLLVFDDYFKKIKRIQSFFKEYLAIRDHLFNRASKIWVAYIKRMLRKAVSDGPENTFLSQVIRIKDSKRNTVLKDYIREKCHNRRVSSKNFRLFLPTRNDIFHLIKQASFDT